MTPRDPHSILPPLDAHQRRQTQAVAGAVGEAIARAGGWIGFDEYLRIVLYAPGLGYYAAGAAKFGAEGDFVTAGEISELFGRCLARQCAELLQTPQSEVLELGAGTGRLAATLLPALAQADALPRRYAILEVSAELRARQRQTLAQLPSPLRARVQWLDELPGQPIDGVVLANEVADALPFRRFLVRDRAVFELGVTLSASGQLLEEQRPADETLRREIERIQSSLPQPWPEPYGSELCLLAGPWVAAIAAALGRGAALIFDYGLPRRELYHPQRSHGSLRCHFRHRAHDDPLRYPGLQDISAWVDFTRLAEGASDAGLTVAGYATQAAFLLATGIEQELAALADTPVERARLAAQARVLLLPGEMGEHVKVLALTRDRDGPLRGFTLQDLRQRL